MTVKLKERARELCFKLTGYCDDAEAYGEDRWRVDTIIQAFKVTRDETIESACELIDIYIGEKESMPVTSEHVCSKLRALISKGDGG